MDVYLRVAHGLADGAHTNYAYDNALGDLVRINYVDGTIEQYTYRLTGQLASAQVQQDGTAHTTCSTYDRHDRLMVATQIGTAADCATAPAQQQITY